MQNEADIVARAARGDKAAFSQIVEIYQNKVYGICLRMLKNEPDALDASQDTFLKIYRSLGRYQKRAAFSTWVYHIATNTCLDALRKKANHPVLALDEEISPAHSEASAEATVLKKFDMGDVAAAIDALDDEKRLAIVLRDIYGLSYEEIAQITNVNLGTLKSRISRARAQLRNQLCGDMQLFSQANV